MKCGTTTLHEYFRKHPEVFVPEIKESDFLRRDTTTRDLITYEGMFSDDYAWRGEVVPSYIDRAELIHSFYPDMKIIILVRDPIERMISHMRHNYGPREWFHYRADDPFVRGTDFDTVLERVREAPLPKYAHDTVRLSLYENTVPRFRALFEDVLVLPLDRLDTSYAEISEFIGAPPYVPEHPLKVHVGDRVEGRPALTLTPEQRAAYREVFEGSYHYLEQHCGIAFDEHGTLI